MRAEHLEELCIQALWKAHDILNQLGVEGSKKVKSDKDVVTKGDRAISEGISAFFSQHRAPIVLYAEEFTEEPFHRKILSQNPLYMVTWDDIDGSKNLEKGRTILPYCSVIALFDGDGTEATFKDARFAAILEHNSKTLWMARRGKGTFVNGTQVYTDQTKQLDALSRIAVDHYAFKAEKAQPYHAKVSEWDKLFWVVDFGASSIHLAGLSSGMFDGYANVAQKAHEIGAGNLLVTEAGGFMSDIMGKPLADQKYDFNAVYQVVGAANRQIGEKLLEFFK
ncbi:hypothetical protein HYV81_03635 [Candidatus Woesearchaeota archaeon]|nr:hypothetical protein [Candidatus Woesearchaeota archaeon]